MLLATHLATVLAVRQGLRSHEGRCSCRVAQCSIITVKLVTHSEVCNLDMSILTEQQVGRFDIAVNNVLEVH